MCTMKSINGRNTYEFHFELGKNGLLFNFILGRFFVDNLLNCSHRPFALCAQHHSPLRTTHQDVGAM